LVFVLVKLELLVGAIPIADPRIFVACFWKVEIDPPDWNLWIPLAANMLKDLCLQLNLVVWLAVEWNGSKRGS
jgi:hypothetical protein